MARAPENEAFAIAIGLRVRSLREEMGLNQEELASRSGVAKGHLSEIERGQVRVTADTLARLGKALHVLPHQLLVLEPDGSDEERIVDRVRIASSSQRTIALAALPEPRPIEPFRKVSAPPGRRPPGALPLLAYAVAAGVFRGARIPARATWVVPRTRRKLRKDMFVAQITGRSMEPDFPDGSYALFDASRATPTHGAILLVQRGGLTEGEGHAAEYLVKRFESGIDGKATRSRDGRVGPGARLVAINPAFDAQRIGPEDDVRIVAALLARLPEV